MERGKKTKTKLRKAKPIKWDGLHGLQELMDTGFKQDPLHGLILILHAPQRQVRINTIVK